MTMNSGMPGKTYRVYHHHPGTRAHISGGKHPVARPDKYPACGYHLHALKNTDVRLPAMMSGTSTPIHTGNIIKEPRVLCSQAISAKAPASDIVLKLLEVRTSTVLSARVPVRLTAVARSHQPPQSIHCHPPQRPLNKSPKRIVAGSASHAEPVVRCCNDIPPITVVSDRVVDLPPAGWLKYPPTWH